MTGSYAWGRRRAVAGGQVGPEEPETTPLIPTVEQPMRAEKVLRTLAEETEPTPIFDQLYLEMYGHPPLPARPQPTGGDRA